MTINLKIEIVKVFKLEFSLTSGKKSKKEEDGAKEESDSQQPADTK